MPHPLCSDRRRQVRLGEALQAVPIRYVEIFIGENSPYHRIEHALAKRKGQAGGIARIHKESRVTFDNLARQIGLPYRQPRCGFPH